MIQLKKQIEIENIISTCDRKQTLAIESAKWGAKRALRTLRATRPSIFCRPEN